MLTNGPMEDEGRSCLERDPRMLDAQKIVALPWTACRSRSRPEQAKPIPERQGPIVSSYGSPGRPV